VADKKTLHFIYNKYADKSISSFENLTELPMEISDGNSVATGESDHTGTDHSHKVSQSVSHHFPEFEFNSSLSQASSSTGVDWDLVREECLASGSIVPYWSTRPEFLTEKSNAELEHLTKAVILAVSGATHHCSSLILVLTDPETRGVGEAYL
jgi:hypothetical protein